VLIPLGEVDFFGLYLSEPGGERWDPGSACLILTLSDPVIILNKDGGPSFALTYLSYPSRGVSAGTQARSKI